MDIVVAGAGPTGLTLACGLLRQGVGVRVVDAAQGPATTSRALVLHARGVEILDRLGALGDLPAHAIPIKRTVLHAGGRRVAELRLGEVPGATPLIASQADIEAALRATLISLGGSIEWGTAVCDAVQDDNGINVTLSRPNQDTERLHAGWLIGCDGAHSQVRALAGVGFPGVSILERFLLADVHVGWDADRDTTASWLHHDGFLLAIPLPGTDDLWRLMADVPASASDDDLPVVERLRRLLPERTGVADAVIGPERWTSSFRLHRRLADRYRSGRMLLAGDAAHIHSPFGGQGMNTGIGDAENLAWKLALVVRGKAEPSLLDSYETERRPVASEVLANTTALTRVLLGAGPLTRLVRDRLAVPLAARPVIQRKAIAKASQLGVTYRRGPLATGPTIRLGPRPRPGDRVPDQRCQHADGGRTRLHAELGTGWVLLVPRGEAPDATAEANKLLGGRLTVLSHEQGPLQLIRPDAHLAWEGRPTDAPGLLHWLRAALTTGRVGR